MRNNIVINSLILCIVLIGDLSSHSLFAQQIKIEDYKHLYNPNVDEFLLDFTPPNAHLLSIAQAQTLRDNISLNNWGEVDNNRIKPDTRSKYYEIDGLLMAVYIWSDSLYWQAEQDALVDELLPPSSNDPYTPIQEKPEKKYKNSMGIRNISDLENYTLHWSNGHTNIRRPYYVSRSVIRPEVELVVYYTNDFGTTAVSIFAFDKDYNYQTRIFITFKKEDLAKAIQAINWIADHMRLSRNIPI